MKHKIKLIIIISTICIAFVACKDKREAFLEEYFATAEEIVKIVDANPTKAGVTKAEEFLNSKKESIKSKFDAGKTKEKMDKKAEDRYLDVVEMSISTVNRLSDKYPALKTELDKLTIDFGEFLMK